MRSGTRSRHTLPGRQRERGLALALALFAMTVLTVAASTGLLVGGAGIKATRNYRGATQVHFAAESALSEALQVINGSGVVNFQNDVVNQWSTTYGTAQRAFAPLTGFTYMVTPVASGVNPANAGRLLATSWGAEGAKNVVVANVIRSNIPSTAPGAIYLASDTPTNSNFVGNNFLVDGNDHNYTGGAGPALPVPGISTRNDTNTQEAINSLSSQEKDNVTGLGYSNGPPIVPSINTSPAAPTVAMMNQISTDLLARPGVVTYPGGDINGNAHFGSTLLPQISHFTGDTTIKGNGNADGAGIMIVDGDLTIQGNLSFKGLILVRGKTQVTASNETEITGNATVYGSLWTNDVNLNVGGSAIIYYSTQALALANMVAGGAALPAPLTVTSIADCAALPAGSGGCP